MVSTLVLIHLGQPGLGHTIKTNFKTFQTVHPETVFVISKNRRVVLHTPKLYNTFSGHVTHNSLEII